MLSPASRFGLPMAEANLDILPETSPKTICMLAILRAAFDAIADSCAHLLRPVA